MSENNLKNRMAKLSPLTSWQMKPGKTDQKINKIKTEPSHVSMAWFFYACPFFYLTALMYFYLKKENTNKLEVLLFLKTGGETGKMPNFFWYGLLIVASLVIFICTLRIAKNKKIVALYTFLSGLIYIFEYVVLVLFNSYTYYPNVLKNSFFDSNVGAIASNAFAVPMAAVFIAAVKPVWKWFLFFVGIFLIIESLFLYLGIFTHNWWRLPYTGIGIAILFYIAIKWYSKLKGNLTAAVRFPTLYFSCITLLGTAVFILSTFLELYHYKIGLFENGARDHIAFATPYFMFISFILTFLVNFNIKWLWKTITLVLMVVCDYLLLQYGILELSSFWSIWYFIILRFFVLVLLTFLNQYFLKLESK